MKSADLVSWLRRLLSSSNPKIGPAQSESEPLALSADAILIDVRSEGEFASGHIEGAVSLPLDMVEAGITLLVPDRRKPLVLYCRSGARSGRARRILTGMGYQTVTNAGGIGSLARHLNRPITRPRP